MLEIYNKRREIIKQSNFYRIIIIFMMVISSQFPAIENIKIA
jgi:hypothetical protein